MCSALVSNLCFAKNCKVLVCCVKWWQNLKCCNSGNELHAFSAAMFNQTNCMDFSVLHTHPYIFIPQSVDADCKRIMFRQERASKEVIALI